MAMSSAMQKIMISNANLINKKPIPKKEAVKKFNENYILEKYPKLKKELLSKNIYYPNMTNAKYLAHDRAMWACHDKQWVND